jgi:hypothetical protein
MRRTLIPFALAVTLLAAVLPAGAEPVDAFHSDNIEHVANVPHLNSKGEATNGGSDIEFFTQTYSVKDAQARFGPGNPIDLDADDDVSNGVQREFALGGTTGNGLHIYDITVPEQTYRTALYDCTANQGDTQVFERDGRIYTTYTTEDSRPANGQCVKDLGQSKALVGTFIIDITDPFAPRSVSFIDVPEGSHNGSMHPSGLYFYNSNSSLYVDTAQDGGPGIEVYDLTDLAKPTRTVRLALPVVPASLGTESHDIAFSPDGTRAYSAALSQGVILDTTDPGKPKIITSFADPTINVWHQADPIVVGDKTFLVVEDEVAGAIPTGQCPNGGVHVFDITGNLEKNPMKVGYWNIDDVRYAPGTGLFGVPAPVGGCTAHVFRLHPEAGIMTIAYYNGGVRVVDLNGLAGIGLGDRAVAGADPMRQLAYYYFENSNSWAAKTPKIAEDGSFYLFSNDRSRGLDVFHYDGTNSPQAQAQGRWMTPAEAEVELTRLSPAQLEANRPYCLL